MSQKEKRLRQVSYLLLKGYNESEIAEHLHVCRRTVVRDVSQLKQDADQWLDDIVDQGYIFEVKQSLDFFRTLRTELFEMLENSQNVGEKLKIMKRLNENFGTYFSIIFKGPMLTHLRKATSLISSSKNNEDL